MDIKNDFFTTGIQFNSYITLNRNLDKRIFMDSKLLMLMIYIALRVKRSNTPDGNNWDGITLDIGDFIIGRNRTVQETDLTEAEYRSRLKKLQELNVITDLQPSSRFTKGKWVQNSFIDLNLEQVINPQDNQPKTNGATTNNNINNSNNLVWSVVHSLNKSVYSTDDYVHVLCAYMHFKGIELKGEEIKDAFWVVKKIFESERTSEQVLKFMKWLHENENREEYSWIRLWTINTVQKKLPEFLAGKLKIRTMLDDYPEA